MLQPHRILIADDDAEIRLGAAELLSGEGRQVVEACNGLEAVELLDRGPLHLALLDVHMPGRTGLEVFEWVRERSLDLPCLFWSGEAEEGTASWLLQSGAAAFLRKPVRPDELRACVRETLERHWGHAS